jgi:hypothetical protein
MIIRATHRASVIPASNNYLGVIHRLPPGFKLPHAVVGEKHPPPLSPHGLYLTPTTGDGKGE